MVEDFLVEKAENDEEPDDEDSRSDWSELSGGAGKQCDCCYCEVIYRFDPIYFCDQQLLYLTDRTIHALKAIVITLTFRCLGTHQTLILVQIVKVIHSYVNASGGS